MSKTKFEWAEEKRTSDKRGKHMRNRIREKNNNWRGGRLKTKHGYILVRVGIHHPLSDCRGYAYEHRVEMSRKIGRWLKPIEKVHHIDGNKTNNKPGNLEMVCSNAEHYLRHRKNKKLKLPNEVNPLIECGCGCGERFLKYDKSNRPRKFISGHNMKNGENYAKN